MTHPSLPPLAPPEPERKYNLPIFLVAVSASLVGVGIGFAITRYLFPYIERLF